MKHGFLPVSREDMKKQNIDQLDFVYVIGDAYEAKRRRRGPAQRRAAGAQRRP